MEDHPQDPPITDQILLDVSVKIEQEGKSFYSKLADMVPSPEVKGFLELMAAEEVKHEKHFRKLLQDKDNQPYGWENRPEIKGLVLKMLQTDLFPLEIPPGEAEKNFQSITQALDFAIESEMVAIEFYRLLGDYCENMEAKTALAMLEGAETEHLHFVTGLREKYAK